MKRIDVVEYPFSLRNFHVDFCFLTSFDEQMMTIQIFNSNINVSKTVILSVADCNEMVTTLNIKLIEQP
jgi:hypothetical protein